jgi:heme/copper-type cytochrome/quinol oxidase subunit 2
MENLISFTLFGSVVAFGIMAVLLFIVFIWADSVEDGEIGFVALLIAIGLNYFWGTLNPLTIISIRNVSIYLFLGFLFSLVRTYFKGKKLNADEKKYFDLKEHVFRWWLMFPICLITWVCRDLFSDFYDFVYSKMSKVYLSIFNA